MRATLKGMKDIMADPAAAAVDFVKATPELAGKEDFVTLSFKLYNQYVYGGQKVLGEMDEARLTALQDFYAKEGLIKSKTRREGPLHQPVRQMSARFARPAAGHAPDGRWAARCCS